MWSRHYREQQLYIQLALEVEEGAFEVMTGADLSTQLPDKGVDE